MRYRPVVITLVAVMTVWGILTFFTMPRREDPEFTIRTCVVSTSWPGTPTVKVEELITDKLEEAIDTIEEIDYLNSETINGQSTIYVNLDDNVPIEAIQNVWDKVRARVSAIEMPAPGIQPRVNDEFGDTTILLMGIYQTPSDDKIGSSSPRLPGGGDHEPFIHNGYADIDPNHQYSPRQLEIYADRIRDAIRLIPGVAKVEKYGVENEAIYIETDLGTWTRITRSLFLLTTSKSEGEENVREFRLDC